ncbi:MAG: Holliday junction resolvase RuvX [Tepidisphaeraceae bacterium]
MRTLAVDPGTRRVGLAISDSSGKFANPLEVLSVRDLEQAIDPILKIVQREDVERLVVGLPLNMDGSLSTFEAEQLLVDRKRGGEKITRKGKKSQLDALAASLILQAFLDGRLQAID